MERLDHVDLEFWNTHDFCKRNKNGTLDTRCTRRKRGEIISQKNDYEEMLKRAERALKRDITKSKPVARDEPLDPENFCDMSNMSKRAARGEETTKKRNPFLFFAEIAASAARMAGSLIARAIPKLASFSPRLSQLLKNSPKNLFKLAPKGQSTNAGSRETMKQAFRKIADHPAFKKCLRDGKPN
jgi:hypothetical protein